MKTTMTKLLVIMLSLFITFALFSVAVGAQTADAQTTSVDEAPSQVTTQTCPSCDATVSDTPYCSACGAEIPKSTPESEKDDFDFAFDPTAFVTNLKYMAAGMVGIFLVIGVIILTILLLGKLTAPKTKSDE